MNKNNLIRFVHLVQGSPEWKEFRKWKIGSSSAASIRGVGFKTPLKLFEDMIEDRETEVNEAMIRGTLMEPKARDWLNDKYKSRLEPCVVQHPNLAYYWHISSMDGIWERPDGSYFACEIKHPGRIDHEMALNGIIPAKYLPQCFHILEDLPGVDRILYCSYRSDDDVAEIWVNRNEYEMRIQFSEELSFMENLLNFIPPAPMDKDWIEIADTDLRILSQEYSFIKDQIEELQNQAETLKQELINGSGMVPRAKIGDLKLQRVMRQGNVDYSKIEALKGMDLKPYRKEPIISWRIS